MNMHMDTPAGLRRAALALHALGTADRNWLLDQLPTPARQTLGELLYELSELGIPADGEVIRVALREASSGDAVPAGEARLLCLVLADEPPAMQSLLLAALPASQHEAVLRHWPYDILARPTAVAAPAWTATFREALLQSWRELAGQRKGTP